MNYKPVCFMIGAFMINLVLGTFYSIGNMMPYIVSYMRHRGFVVSISVATYVTSTFLLGQGLFLILGSYLEQKLGCRIVMILGCIIHSASTFCVIWAVKTSMFLVVMFYGFGCGLGTGLAYMMAISGAQKWYPHNKGIATGIIVAGFGFGGLVFTYLQTALTNPTNESVRQEGEYSDVVANRVPSTIMSIGFIFLAFQAIGCCLAFEPKRSDSETSHTTITDEVLPDIKVLKDVFKYRIFYVIAIILVLLAPGVTFVNSLGKRFGSIYIKDDKFLSVVIAVSAIFNAGGRVTWGYMTDKLPFTVCLGTKVIIFSTLMLLFPSYFILSSRPLYAMVMFGLFFGFSGVFVLFPVYIEQIFSVKFSGMVYGILYVCLALASCLTSIILQSSSFLSDINSAQKYMHRFWPCFLIAFFYIIALAIYLLTLPFKRIDNSITKRNEAEMNRLKDNLYAREDLYPLKQIGGLANSIRMSPESVNTDDKEGSLGSIVRYRPSTIAQAIKGSKQGNAGISKFP